MHTDINQLLDHLNKLPNQIREAQEKVIQAKHNLEEVKLEYDVFFSQALIDSERPNATEKKSEAMIRARGKRNTVLEREREEAQAENELEYLNNRFIALRKISSIEESLIKSQLTGV